MSMLARILVTILSLPIVIAARLKTLWKRLRGKPA